MNKEFPFAKNDKITIEIQIVQLFDDFTKIFTYVLKCKGGPYVLPT